CEGELREERQDVGDHEELAGLPGGVDHGVGVLRPQRDGLLDEDVLAGPEGGDGGGGGLVGGVADVDEGNVRVGEEGGEVVVLLDAGEVHDLAGRPEVAADAAPVAGELLRVAAADGGDLGVAHLAGGQVVDHAHKPHSYDPNSHHCRISFCFNRLRVCTV